MKIGYKSGVRGVLDFSLILGVARYAPSQQNALSPLFYVAKYRTMLQPMTTQVEGGV
jgi:hypothetical protein